MQLVFPQAGRLLRGTCAKMNSGKIEAAAAARPLAVSDYVRDIELCRPFAYTKINHGMWDLLARINRARARGVTDPAELDRLPRSLSGFVETGFCDELRALVRRAQSPRGDLRFGSSISAFPHDDRLYRVPFEPPAESQVAMDDFMAGAPLTADTMLWKTAVLDGSIAELYRALRSRDVALIGPSSLRHFGAFARLPNFRFIEIDGRSALIDRARIAADLCATHRAEAHTVYLVQAGPLSAWLILTLMDELANATFLDLGIVLDLCSVNQALRQLWPRYYREEVAGSIVAINPAWPDDPRAYEGDPGAAGRRALWRCFSGGILPEIAEIAGLPERRSGLGNFDRPDLAARGRVRFVEDKRIDWQRVEEILELSRRANHWTNFGPVSQALERVLEHALRLPPERAVVACASASAGLTALAGLHAVKLGRPLRWLVSAYTFAVQRTGAFADALVVDCNDAGLIDLTAVKRLRKDAWDGMVLTNVFGTLADTERFEKFCRKRGKSLIIDSAAALLGRDRKAPGLPAEAISFHHTKPWGVGEGGCVIVDRADADLVRSALNFGFKGPDLLRKFSGNGKISEFACALILDRLERLPSWSHFYCGQRLRILRSCRGAGLELLCGLPDDAIAGSVPMLARRPISASDLADRPFDMGKYYPPLDRRSHNAQRIFTHIVNVPCHAGMAAMSSDIIQSTLQDLAQARPQFLERVTGRWFAPKPERSEA